MRVRGGSAHVPETSPSNALLLLSEVSVGGYLVQYSRLLGTLRLTYFSEYDANGKWHSLEANRVESLALRDDF